MSLLVSNIHWNVRIGGGGPVNYVPMVKVLMVLEKTMGNTGSYTYEAFPGFPSLKTNVAKKRSTVIVTLVELR